MIGVSPLLAQEVQQVKRIRLVQVAVAVAEPDVKLQRLAEPQSLMEPEPQQHPVGQPGVRRCRAT